MWCHLVSNVKNACGAVCGHRNHPRGESENVCDVAVVPRYEGLAALVRGATKREGGRASFTPIKLLKGGGGGSRAEGGGGGGGHNKF